MYRDVCDIYCYDEPKVRRVKSYLESDFSSDMTKIFKALSDDTRVKIALSLCREKELCVCDIANIIGSSVANTSHHLRLLRNWGLARYRKEGKLAFYSLEDDHVRQLVMMAMEHSKEGKGVE